MSVNKVILVGRVGRDPEIKHLPNGEAVVNFSVATSEQWKDRNGERQERAEWHNITMYRRLAEIAGQYVKKGSQVYIEGRIQSRKYTGKDGVERTAYEIIGSEMKMIGGRSEATTEQSEAARQEAYATQPPPRPTQAPAPPQLTQAQQAVVDDIDDDIPF